jgi:hypothetical protein
MPRAGRRRWATLSKDERDALVRLTDAVAGGSGFTPAVASARHKLVTASRLDVARTEDALRSLLEAVQRFRPDESWCEPECAEARAALEGAGSARVTS